MATQPGYGLILKKKKNPAKGASSAAAAFGGDSSDDESDDFFPCILLLDIQVGPAVSTKQGGRAGVNYMMLQEAKKNKSNKKTQQGWMKAMEEDATVFQYDEVYDEIDQKKGEDVQRRQGKKAEDKRPKLIYQLMANAKKKKLQDELREERQAQREREIEGEAFADKDVFVTGAYKKKLIELKAAAEEDRRKELEEERNDVTKKKDLSDLWRNMYSKQPVEEPAAAANPSDPAAAKGRAATADEPAPRARPSAADADAPRDRQRRRRERSASPPRERSASPPREHTRTHRGEPPTQTRPRERRPRRRTPPPATRAAGSEAESETDTKSKYARRTSESALSDARARYVARKAARGARKLATFDA
eukprot:m.126636 g.126636  ORF g.126636 m.126636 type:complete len:363 (+) comp17381_c0_seq8:106-1194(+)